MSETALLWLGLNILSLFILSFYSMMELACVSFNKVRLQHYVSIGQRQALLLNDLLNNSYALFGTTLIGVNVAMIFGSEFSRQFHSAIGVNPDLAPLTQVMIVIIFGELAPMFAARRYAEHLVMLGVPILYASSKLMTPFLWCIKHLTHFVYKIFGGHEKSANIFLTQDELQKLIGEREEHPVHGSAEELDAIVGNIFTLRQKAVWQVMSPIYAVPMIPSSCTVGTLRQILENIPHTYLPVYHKALTNIVGIAYPRDLIRESNTKKVRERARQPWFITQSAPILDILKQFRRNHQSLAVVLDRKGQAVGILTLEDLLDELFGAGNLNLSEHAKAKPTQTLLIERSFPGTMKIGEFNAMFNVSLNSEGCETFAELVEQEIGHTPEEGDTVSIPPFEIKVKEASLLEVKTVTIRTKV